MRALHQAIRRVLEKCTIGRNGLAPHWCDDFDGLESLTSFAAQPFSVSDDALVQPRL